MSVLLMLATILVLVAAVFLIIISSIKQMQAITKFVFGAAAIWMSIYFALLFFTSLTGKEKVLTFNEPKTFCGFYLDCHLHVAVTNVRQTKTIGEGTNQKSAQGMFHIVSIRVFSNAKKATLNLITPIVRVVDEKGKVFERSTEAETILEIVTGNSDSLETKIGPEGDSIISEVVFDLPADMENPKLEINEGFWMNRAAEYFLIGDEDSMFHKKVKFSLEPQNSNSNSSIQK